MKKSDRSIDRIPKDRKRKIKNRTTVLALIA